MAGPAAKRLSKKELLFCGLYASLRNGREAALGAGYLLSPELRGAKLLLRPEIRRKIEQLTEKNRFKAEAAAGFRRLAFGCAADAVSLLFAGEDFDPGRLRGMDLFNIAEIKQLKSGQVEIKFFDRHKALEKLFELGAAEAGEETRAFFEALDKGARSRANDE